MEELQKEVDPHSSVEQSPKIGKLALALSKAQGAMDGAKKASINPHFKSRYADLFECLEAARKPLADNELAVIQTMRPATKGVDIVTTLAHSSGEWIRSVINMVPRKDDDQGRGSSITYGRRYSFAAIVGIAQKDDDGNASCEKGSGDRKSVEEIKEYIDMFCKADPKTKKLRTPSQLEDGYRQNITPIIKQYTSAEQRDITSAYNETLAFLKEAQ